MRSRVLGLAAITLTLGLTGIVGTPRRRCAGSADCRGRPDYRSQIQSAAHAMG